MAMNKRNRFRPVTNMNEIISGQPYIQMLVWYDGTMSLDRHVFLGRPYKHKLSKRVKAWWIDEAGSRFGVSLADHGVVLHEQRDNRHRLFRHNSRNLAILSDLVERQALEEYLALIGLKDPEKIANEHRSRPSLDVYDDEYDFDDYLHKRIVSI